MVTTLLLGFRWGIALTMSTLVVSNLILGFGLWTLPQIVAYAMCLVVVQVSVTLIPLIRLTLWIQIGIAGLLRYLYGFIVSLGMAVIGSLNGLGFWAYYLSGLLFANHAFGNLVVLSDCGAGFATGIETLFSSGLKTGGSHEAIHKSRDAVR